ncbi:MAG: VWA domain-containing protein [Pseudonocardia sp.]|nr:VWA domain-containing protein [Pseudonocardia sp.]
MELSQPGYLLLLLVVAGLGVGYWWLQRLRRRDILRFSAMELVEKVAPNRPGRSRHIPVAALLVALVLLTIALTGPTVLGKAPRNRATVMLVIDVSLSMQATDVAPTRLAAAQAAAKSFVNDLPPTVNLGLESFAGTAAVLVSPTVDHQGVLSAIDGLKLAESTATGEAIFSALQAIEGFSRSVPGDAAGPPPAQVVLMSDGKQTLPGPDAENDPRGCFTAARQAKTVNVPISTIAFGTTWGTIDLGGRPTPVPVDEPTMRTIAKLSGGSTFSAISEDELRQVYGRLRDQIGYEIKRIDISKAWFLAGTIAVMVGLGSGLALGRRIP